MTFVECNQCIAEEPVEDMGNPNPFEDEDLPTAAACLAMDNHRLPGCSGTCQWRCMCWAGVPLRILRSPRTRAGPQDPVRPCKHAGPDLRASSCRPEPSAKDNAGCVASGAYRYRKITLPGNPKAHQCGMSRGFRTKPCRPCACVGTEGHRRL